MVYVSPGHSAYELKCLFFYHAILLFKLLERALTKHVFAPEIEHLDGIGEKYLLFGFVTILY